LASRVPWLRTNPPEFLREHFYMTRIGTEPFDVDWGCGAAMLFRKSFFPHLLSFDERFLLYFEDVDICSKAWQEGLGVAYYPKLVCLHEDPNQGRNHFMLLVRHIEDMFRYIRKYQGLPNRTSLLSKE
jgi:GT2 family glycosyltransferase